MLSLADPSAAPTVYDPQLILSLPKQPVAAVKPVSLYYHVIFHLETEGGIIDDEWRKFFYKYIAGCLKALGCELEAIGGAGDHVHLLLGVDSSQALADVVRRIMLLSESWVRRRILCCDFKWQEDYQAFTVSLSERGRVKRYILNQREHKRSFALSEKSSPSWGCVLRSELYV